MKAKLLVLLMLLTAVPPTAIAQAPGADPTGSVPDPNANVPGIPRTEQAVPYDEAVPPIERFDCPTDHFESKLLDGKTPWQNGTHRKANDECVAQWGDGSYRRGTDAVLESPGLPTSDLAVTSEPREVLNTLATTLIENGVSPELAARVVGAQAGACRFQVGSNVVDPQLRACKEALEEASGQIRVPNAAAGVGALYMQMRHAYAFSEEDDNNLARDGGWVEVRRPGEGWERLHPVALASTAQQGVGVLCAITGPTTAGLNDLTTTRLPGGVDLGNARKTVEDAPQSARVGEFNFTNISPFGTLPSSADEWERDCGSILSDVYAQRQTLPVREGRTGTEADVPIPPRAAELRPYPGTVRGHGPGFVGSTADFDGEPNFVNHFFDLSPYAGETVEIRFRAIGGAGLGERQGGWWIDDVNVRYDGPPHDLGVHIETPRDGDSVPPGETSVTTVVRNLGRTPSQPTRLVVSAAGSVANVTVPSLDPLEEQRATVTLPVPEASRMEITANLESRASAQGRSQTGPYTDSFPLNDEASIGVAVEELRDLQLSIRQPEVEEGEANVTIAVINLGNDVVSVPVEATLTPVDLITRVPRPADAQSLGTLETVVVPFGESVRSSGVQDPTVSFNTTVVLPEPGVWQLSVQTPVDADAGDEASVTFREAAPTALEAPLAGVVKGPTTSVANGSFELTDIDPIGDEDAASMDVLLRDPIRGPETLFVPRGDFALASSGRELPHKWSVFTKENPAEGASIDPHEDCGIDVDGEGKLMESPMVRDRRQNIEDAVDAACLATGITGGLIGSQCGNLPGILTVRDNCRAIADDTQDTTEPISQMDTEYDTPGTFRTPASLQAWNVRQHHVTVYPVGTEGENPPSEEDEDTALTEKVLADLRPVRDEDRAILEFRHAADVNWSSGYGSRARVMVVPKGEVDVVEAIREAENVTRAATAPLPPDERALARETLMNAFFDSLGRSVSDTVDSNNLRRFPGDVCRASPELPQGLGDVNALLGTICGDAQVIQQLSGACSAVSPAVGEGNPVQCHPTETGSSTFLRASGDRGRDLGSDEVLGNATSNGIIREFRSPRDWENVTIDITPIVEETAPRNEEHGLYVIFDLVTMTDMEDVLASARAEDDPGGTDVQIKQPTSSEKNDLGQRTDVAARFGWTEGERPLWTVDDPLLKRVRLQEAAIPGEEPDEEIMANWALCDRPSTDCGGTMIQPVDRRGWKFLPREPMAQEMPWRYEALAGDPDSIEPGTLVWEGGTGELVHDERGNKIVRFEQNEPEPYGVLRTPTVDLSGYEKPVAKLHVEWSKVSVGPYPEPIEMKKQQDGNEKFMDIEARCEAEKDTTSDATVWARTGWNVRVRPLHENGTITSGPPKTVPPVGGYDQCSEEGGDVPILFNASAVIRGPWSANTEDRSTDAGLTDDTAGTRSDPPACFSGIRRDPLQFCRETTMQFGHKQPVFALPMPWQDVTIDLSEFRGEEVKLEVHAFGIEGFGDAKRGELKVDTFTVTEGAPPIDLAADHEKRPFIAPGSEERFNLTVQNLGRTSVEQVTIRRTVTGPDGCQFVQPTQVTRRLVGPEGELGLPPGANFTIKDPQLAWDVSDDPNEQFQRRITIDPRSSLPESAQPELSIRHILDSGRVTVAANDPDDCGEEIEIHDEVLHGDVEIEEDDGIFTIEQDPDDDEELLTQTPTVKLWAVDGAGDDDREGTESLPAYIAPPPERIDRTRTIIEPVDRSRDDSTIIDDALGTGSGGQGDLCPKGTLDETTGRKLCKRTISDPLMEANGTTDAEVLQSAADATGTDSLVRITAKPADPSLRINRLVIPCECPGGNVSRQNFQQTLIEDLPPGRYFGYVTFGGEDYAPVRFTIEERPEPGRDAREGDNEVSLRGETRPIPRLEITEIDLPAFLNTSEEVDIPIRILNAGNVPLRNVSTSVEILPMGTTLEVDRIQRLEPGDQTAKTATVSIAQPGPIRLKVSAVSEPIEATGEPATVATGAGVLVLSKQEISSAGGGSFDPWKTGETVRLGDGIRVPADANQILPLQGRMDLSRSPLSALFLNQTGTLEKSYDGVGLEWERSSQDAIKHGLSTKLTSSHAGGEAGSRTPAFTGDLNASAAWSTDLPGTKTRKVDEIEQDEWRHRGGFMLDESDGRLDDGRTFWMPTATVLGEAANSQIKHELRIPLTVGDWCSITQDLIPQSKPLRIETAERRLFSESSSETRGWEAKVLFKTGEFNDPTVGTKSLPATPVVSLPDEEMTGWETVAYEVQLSPLIPAIEDNAFPGSPDAPDDVDACTWFRNGNGNPDKLSNANIVLQLRTEPGSGGSATGGFDVGWFVSQVEAPDLDLQVGASAQANYVASCGRGNPESPPFTNDGLGLAAGTRTIEGCSRIIASGAPDVGGLSGDHDNEPTTADDLGTLERVQNVELGPETISFTDQSRAFKGNCENPERQNPAQPDHALSHAEFYIQRPGGTWVLSETRQAGGTESFFPAFLRPDEAVFDEPGTWRIKLACVDENGDRDQATWSVEIRETPGGKAPPIAERRSPSSPVAAVTGDSQTFDARCQKGGRSLSSGTWEVKRPEGRFASEDTTQSQSSFTDTHTVTFDTTGTWIVKWLCEDTASQSDIATWTVNVHSTSTQNQAPRANALDPGGDLAFSIGEEVDVLSDLFTERPFEDHGGGILSPKSDDMFRYIDSLALVDLRAGTQGTLRIDLDTNARAGVIQLVTSPVEPDEDDAFGEQAPLRVPFQPLRLPLTDKQARNLPGPSCPTVEPARSSAAETPLGATVESPVGTVPALSGTGGSNERWALNAQLKSDSSFLSRVCADLSPVAGQLALVGVRAWLPEGNDRLKIKDAEVYMDVPKPEQITPQLRAMTDDTVLEGTYELHDAAMLSMAPPFSHRVDLNITDTQRYKKGQETRDLLFSNGFPALRINVTEPGRAAEWNISVHVRADYIPQEFSSETTGNVPTETVSGLLSLDEDEYTGSQFIEIPWQDLREPLDWISEEPVIPRNVTRLKVNVHTEPDALAETPQGCDTDELEELKKSGDLGCRAFSDLVESDDTAGIARWSERALHHGLVPNLRSQTPGVVSVDILPDRAPPGTPRTAVVEIDNPSSSPVEVRGNLSSVEEIVGGSGDIIENRLGRTKVDPLLVEPWSNRTVEIPVTLPRDEHPRVLVEADIGDGVKRDGYRTTTAHESDTLLDVQQFVQTSGVQRTSETSKPPMEGQRDDGVGYRIENSGGTGTIEALRTNTIPLTTQDANANEESLQSLLRKSGPDPVFTFQHQRQLRDGNGPDFAYMAITARGPGGDPMVLNGWAPESSSAREAATATNSQGNSFDACHGTDGSSEAQAEGMEDITNTNGEQIFRGSTGGELTPDVLDSWESVVAPIPVDDLLSRFNGFVQFSIVLANCQPQGSSTILVDDVSIASARPVVTLGSKDIPIQPGTEKRYRFLLENRGSASDAFHVVPSAKLPQGWEVTVEMADGTQVYDSRKGKTEPVRLGEGETTRGILRVALPGDASGGIERALPLTAYAVDAPGLASSAAVNASTGGQPQDPGDLTFRTTRVDQPDLVVDAGSITVEDAEVNRRAKIQFKIENRGSASAKDVPVRVAVKGPSGFQPLACPDDTETRETFPAGSRKFFTCTWNPRKPGLHRLRIIADAPEAADAQDLLVKDDLTAFFGLVQESEECEPGFGCDNVVDHTVDVSPLKRPELSLRVSGTPDRIAAGQPTPLTVVVENNGGRTAHDVKLRLSENGLLPLFDTLTVELGPIEPGNATVLNPTWTPVTSGDILILGSVGSPSEFTGRRADGSSAGSDNDVAIPVRVDRASSSVSLSEPVRTEPGSAHVVEATVANDGTSALTISPTTVRKGPVFLSPVLDAPVTVPSGETRTVPMLGFALLGAQPGTTSLPVPISQGKAKVDVTVVEAPGARVTLDERPVVPGQPSIDARVTNDGNVPLDGTLTIRGQGIQGAVDVEVPVGATRNVTIETTILPGTQPGVHPVATHVHLDDTRLTEQHRIRVDEAPAVGFELTTADAPLAGSATGELVVRNIGNQPLDGRLTVDGPVSVAGSPVLDLDPGESSTHDVTWLSATNRTGIARVLGFGDDVVGETLLEPDETGPELELLRVSTRPSVNLQEGMQVQVVGAVENRGDATLENATLGITVDGELFQTFQIGELEAGETTVVSAPIELPRAGSLTIGLVDLAAFQRGESAGPATTLEVAEGSIGLGTIAAVPSLPWYAMISLVALAAGVKRE